MLFNIKNIHIEISTKCVLKCPRCPRTELDLGTYINQEISFNNFKQGFPHNVLTEVDSILFSGHAGDPIYATSLIDIVRYIKQNSNTKIRITTNGSYKKPEWWKELGELLGPNDRVNFSVDGWNNQMNNLYRINSDFLTIIDGIKTLKLYSKCKIVWKTIYFSFNQMHIEKIKSLATSVGCDKIVFVKSSKFDNQYAINGIDELKPLQHYVADTNTYEIHFDLVDNVVPLDFMESNSLNRHPWAKCINHTKEIFISVDGLVFPCPWFNGGYQENKFVQKHINKLSIKNRPLLDVLNDPVWNELNFDDSPLEVCNIKCKHG